jgi:glycine dehydrogenase subunit 2
MYSKEDIDYWIATMATICKEAHDNPDLVRTAPHRQPIHQIKAAPLEDPGRWAMTWRAYQRKTARRPIP